jgi:hypothetical protein
MYLSTADKYRINIMKFNHLINEYDSVAEEKEALVYRGTFPVEVWRDGEHVDTVEVDIYSDIPYEDFSDKALARLGEFVSEE